MTGVINVTPIMRFSSTPTILKSINVHISLMSKTVRTVHIVQMLIQTQNQLVLFYIQSLEMIDSLNFYIKQLCAHINIRMIRLNVFKHTILLNLDAILPYLSTAPKSAIGLIPIKRLIISGILVVQMMHFVHFHTVKMRFISILIITNAKIA